MMAEEKRKELDRLEAKNLHNKNVSALTDPIFENIEGRLFRRMGILAHLWCHTKGSDSAFYRHTSEIKGLSDALRAVEEEFIEDPNSNTAVKLVKTMSATFICDGCGKEVTNSSIYVLKSGKKLCWNCFYQGSIIEDFKRKEALLKSLKLTPEQYSVIKAHLSELKATTNP